MHSKRSKLLNLAITALFVTFLHMWYCFKIQSNKTFSWEYSSITAAVCSSLKPLTPSRPCSKQSSHRTLASSPPTGPTVTFPLPNFLDLVEPGVLLFPGMFLLRSTALFVSPSDHGPANSSRGAPPLLLDLFLFIYLQILLLLSEIFIMICMFGCIFMNNR